MKNVFKLIGVVCIPLLIINFFWRQNQLKNARYTITTTLSEIRTLKNGLQVKHAYIVENKKYVEFYNKDERLAIQIPGGKYLIKYSKNHPGVSKVIWTKELPDSMKNVEIPQSGWQTPPF